jgi:hypothetical protein
MKSDVNGCSSCPAGTERYEEFYSPVLRKRLVQYDYRTSDGELFSCVAPTLEACRERRNAGLGCRRMESRV